VWYNLEVLNNYSNGANAPRIAIVKLNDYLMGIAGARIVSLRTKTDVKLLAASKTKFPKGISKIASRNGTIGAKYQNAVNNKLVANLQPTDDVEKVPFFEAESLWKGKGRNVDNFLVEHSETKEKYLKFLPKQDSEGFNRTESIYVDNATGVEICKEDFAEFMPKQNSVSSHGVNWQVIKVSSLLGINQITLDTN
jgi:hypothetical protein